MATGSVVPAFDESEHGHARFGLGLERTPVDELTFKRGEQALRHRIVVAIAGGPGRSHDSPVPTSLAESERSVLCPLLGVMDDPLGAALCERHVQRLEHPLDAKMVGHGPPHDLAAESIEHEGQIHEPGPGRHERDVGHPELVRRIGPALTLPPVRSRAVVALHTRGTRAPAPADSDQARLSHPPSNALTAHLAGAFHPLRVSPRHRVRAVAIVVDAANHRAQLLVATRTTGSSTASPRVVPAGGHPQHSAHRGHPMMGLVRLHEREDLPGIVPVSRANQAAAFLKSRAPREADGSHSAAAAVPQALNSSDRPHDVPRRGPLGAPNGGAPTRSTQTRGPAPRRARPVRTSSTLWRRYSGAYGGCFFVM